MKKNNDKRDNTGIALWNEAKKIIPGGSQLFGKRAELFLPEQWPTYYKKAKGVYMWDLDGRKLTDMSYMGIGCCLLGYADPDVDKAVKKVIDSGSMATLNCTEEVELAQVLLKIHPWAEMVRYARTGGEAMTIAVRLARAYSGKDKIAFCGYHSWHDWYLSANLANNKNLDGQLIPGLEPKGVPRALSGVALPFHYNKIEELEKIVKENSDIGVIVVEPSRHQPPQEGFFEKVKEIAKRVGAVLIFDEVQIGWTSSVGGLHLEFGVNPDIVVYAKAIANGYPMAAILGTKGVMQKSQETFASSTFWTERVGPAAALATIKKMQAKKIHVHIKKIGKLIQDGWKKAAIKYNLDITIGAGTFAKPEFSLNYGDQNQAIRTLLTQEMLKRGFVDMACVYVSYEHKESHVKKYMKAVDKVFAFIADAIQKNEVIIRLDGPIAHNRFKRLD
ncbi:MAG: aminotransferase class III-fold pyridoxal phosphate-dependent enzyme [Candidatus Taylorbacteria bacterium]|nr:aminotransferase class III-fold pyridoxal phosphate-dependent enzyme [Candidatus Taylorbacteria bacterium]